MVARFSLLNVTVKYSLVIIVECSNKACEGVKSRIIYILQLSADCHITRLSTSRLVKGPRPGKCTLTVTSYLSRKRRRYVWITMTE